MKATRDQPEKTTEVITSPSYPTAQTLEKLQKRRRRNIIIIGAVLLLLSGITYLESRFLEKPSIGIFALFNLNIVLLILLSLLILRNLFKLFMERKQRHAGSKFRSKMVITFVVISMLPTILLAVIGSGLIADAIKNWFNPQIEQYIDQAMDVARKLHSIYENRTVQFAKQVARTLQDQPLGKNNATVLKSLLQVKLKEYQLTEIRLYDVNYQQILTVRAEDFPFANQLQSFTPKFKSILAGDIAVDTRRLHHGELLQIGVPVYSAGTVHGLLFVGLYLPETVTHGIRSIQRNFEAYKQQKQAIKPTQALYISIFLLIALTILFGAIWLGIYIAKQISIPISHLDEATNKVSKGKLDFKLNVLAYDEIGGLIQSFNRMTDQLRMNRDLIQETNEKLKRRNEEIIARKNQLEAILQNIGAGVLSVDLTGRITSINSTAAGLLRISEEQAIAGNFREVFIHPAFSEFSEIIQRALEQKSGGVQREVKFDAEHKQVQCSVSIAPILDASQKFNGLVVVIDDLTQLLRMQKIAAWREVARRLAHEIKNPLTPIQLNTERLRKKFSDQSPDFPAVLERATTTIINEVQALRRMLDEFSRFARLPEAHRRAENLHDIIRNVVTIYQGSNEKIRFEQILDSQVPQMLLDKEQIKRVFINLIENAVDVMKNGGTIVIATRFDPVFNRVYIYVSDEGKGVRPEDKDKLFLPYFSTKGQGSGLGLAICNRIISDHDGTIRVMDNKPRGTKFVIELPGIILNRTRGTRNGQR